MNCFVKLRARSFVMGLTTAVVFAWGARSAPASDYQVLVTLAPSGGGSFQPVWRFRVAGSGGAMTQLGDIPADLTNDPVAATFLTKRELLISNRHGMSGDGSISRFEFSSDLESFAQLSTVTGGGLANVHQIAVDYTHSELFAVNADSYSVSRFAYTPSGDFIPVEVIYLPYDGRGVAVSEDGNTIYVSALLSPYILRYVRVGNTFTEISPIVVSGAGFMHYIKFRNGEMYIGDIVSQAIHRIAFDADGNPVQKPSIYSSPSPIDVAFSPDGSEMFVANHGVGELDRYTYDEPSDSWVMTWSQPTPQLGGITTAFGAPDRGVVATDDYFGINQGSSLVVPAPGVLANDDTNEGSLGAELASTPSHASSFQLNADGSFAYVPSPFFYGEDSFTYRAQSGSESSEVATVHITVSQPGAQGFITGGGKFRQSDRKCTFGFVAKVQGSGVQGDLEFEDHDGDVRVKSTGMQWVYSPNRSEGYFRGACKLNGMTGYTFFVQVHDRGAPGTSDDFTIWVLDGASIPVYSSGGTLVGGNIVIH